MSWENSAVNPPEVREDSNREVVVATQWMAEQLGTGESQ
jgi:hypothetical protein